MQNRIELLEDNFNFSKLDTNDKWVVLICSKFDKELNHKKYYRKHKKHFEEYNRKWRKNNPEYQKEYSKTENGKTAIQKGSANRRSREREIINTLTYQEWLDVLKEYDYKCAYCGIKFDDKILPTKDHIIPISRGGNNIKENIVPACRSCNAKKHNKILDSNNLPISFFRS